VLIIVVVCVYKNVQQKRQPNRPEKEKYEKVRQPLNAEEIEEM